jgi:hypothetical protein
MLDLSDSQIAVPFAQAALQEEYMFLQKIVEDFNNQSIEFKKWTVSLGIAALIAAYSRPVAKSGAIGVTIAALSSIPFWLIDSFWKLFQNSYYDRLKEIEACIRDSCRNTDPFQIYTSWNQAWDKIGFFEWVEVFFLYWHVSLPHAFLLLLGLTLAAFFPPALEPGQSAVGIKSFVWLRRKPLVEPAYD